MEAISISARKIMIQCNMNKTHFSFCCNNDHANFWFPNRFNSSDCSLFRKWHCSDLYTLALIQWLALAMLLTTILTIAFIKDNIRIWELINPGPKQ